MPSIDHEKFAFAVAGKLKEFGVPGPRAAQEMFPAVRLSTWSRIGHGHVLTAENMIAVCELLDLDPREFVLLHGRNSQDLHALKRQRKQTVSRNVSHETARLVP